MKRLETQCLLDCFAFALSEQPSYDYRPLYFGAWNPQFALNQAGTISYYSKFITSDVFLERFQYLYRQPITVWHNLKKSRRKNFQYLLRDITSKPDHCYHIILVDGYYLCYPNQCYKIKHAPHIVMLESYHPTEGWSVIDPYFGWRGVIDHQSMAQAFGCGKLIAGFRLDKRDIQVPDFTSVCALFESTLSLESNDLIDLMKPLFQQALQTGSEYSMRNLSEALAEIGTMGKRKNAYLTAVGFFSDGTDPDPRITESSSKLIARWNSLSIQGVRLGIVPSLVNAEKLYELLLEIESLEQDIKTMLWSLYMQWREETSEIETVK
ncbi:hypothetical protein DFP94_10950 [Fontibacillus phaseoli]|uniref:Butirosin biosynthesis protein H-like n=1 Tax=Fontibacillus phaseoli TaxID=1416533 RepID=A0A369B9U2_9BACL|nr:DUF6005 family protein [Fontibacillus phaseoli]RCX17326.1 hypothetical protein DFP94_10950 [Fontibacillus phaseoli]